MHDLEGEAKNGKAEFAAFLVTVGPNLSAGSRSRLIRHFFPPGNVWRVIPLCGCVIFLLWCALLQRLREGREEDVSPRSRQVMRALDSRVCLRVFLTLACPRAGSE